jgi:hypothetical protein
MLGLCISLHNSPKQAKLRLENGRTAVPLWHFSAAGEALKSPWESSGAGLRNPPLRPVGRQKTTALWLNIATISWELQVDEEPYDHEGLTLIIFEGR